MKWHRQLAILGTASLLLGLTGCSGSSANTEPISYTGTALDTVINIKIYDSQDNNLLTRCQKICDDYEARLSRTREGSEIWQINHAEGAYTEVSDDTLKLIREGLHYSELSDGAFDITIGTVTELWDFKSDDPQVPDASVLAEAVTHVDYHNIEIDGNLVRLSDPESKIDLGAIAKGFIADKLKEYLKNLAKELGVSDKVKFLGYRKDVLEIYKIADLFLFPSKREGLPCSLIEAMACGLPCVASDVRGNKDLLRSDNLCKSNKEEEWLRLLNKAFCEKILVNELQDIYGVSHIKKNMQDIYGLN